MMRQNQAKAFSMSIRYFINNKKHGDAVLFCVHRMLWLSAPNPDARNFSRKVSWNFKSFAQNEVAYSVRKFLRIFKGLFTKSLLKQGLERSSNILRQYKKHGNAVLFCALNIGAVRPKPGRKKLFEKSFLELQKLCSK